MVSSHSDEGYDFHVETCTNLLEESFLSDELHSMVGGIDMSFPFSWLRNTYLASSGFTASVDKVMDEHSVVELEVPSDREMYVWAISLFNCPGLFVQRETSSLIVNNLVTHPNNPETNFSPGILSTAIQRSGTTPVSPDVNGLFVPSHLGTGMGPDKIFTLEHFTLPLIIGPGEFVSLICSVVNHTCEYGLRWYERESA